MIDIAPDKELEKQLQSKGVQYSEIFFCCNCKFYKKGACSRDPSEVIKNELAHHCPLFSARKKIQTVEECATKTRKKRSLGQHLSNIEFDPDKVLREKPFPMVTINTSVFGFGLLLPNYMSKRNKKGQVTHIEQVRSPYLICSDGQLHSISKRFEEEYKIRFEEVSTSLELRWNLRSIKKYLDGEDPTISGYELFSRIKKIYETYLYFQNERWYSIHALWDIGTYFFMLFRAYPIFEVRGMSGTAKTKIMAVSNAITFNACNEIMVNPSESTLFRETHAKRITKYIDEAEKLFKFERGQWIEDDRVTFINQSYSCKGAVPRQDKVAGRFVTVYYKAYSPTMIGSINGMHGATQSRAIVHIMTKNPASDKRGDLEPKTESKAFADIRNDLYLFALQNWKEIKKSYDTFDNDTTMRSRDFQIWKPLLCIAKVLDAELYQQMKESAERLTSVRDEQVADGTKELKILKVMKDLIYSEQYEGRFFVKDIIARYPGEYKPHPKTVSGCLELMGFRDQKKRTMHGTAFEISKELFELIATPMNTSLFASSPSSASLLDIELDIDIEDINKKKEYEANPKTMKEMNQTKKSNDANDEMSNMKQEGKDKGLLKSRESTFWESYEVLEKSQKGGIVEIMKLQQKTEPVIQEKQFYGFIENAIKLGDLMEVSPGRLKKVT